MDKLHIEVCPVCGGTDFGHYMNCTDFYATGEHFEVCQCADCGFRFTDGAPVESEIGRYYETPDYISHSDTSKGLMNKVYHWVRSYMLSRKARLVAKASGMERGTMLDYGTGTGYFANQMRKAGWTVRAIEKSAQAREFARTNFGLEVWSEQQMDQVPTGSLDVVTLWHVMEHVENLDRLWSEIDRWLRKDGTLIVAVPNCSGADEAIYGAHWAAYDVPRHLWHFVPPTMRRLAERKGYEMCQTLPMPFDAFYVSMLSEKYRGSKAYFVKGMLSGARALVKAWADKNRSSSIIYVMRKR